MAPELSRWLCNATFALMALAALATEVAAEDSRSVARALGIATIWVGLAIGASFFVATPSDSRRVPPRSVLLVLLFLGAIPFLVEPLVRSKFETGNALEVQMVFGLRNIGLGLAACGCWLLCQRLACVVSLFLILFAVTMADGLAVMILLGLYSATGSVWLMLVYWTGLRRFFVASDSAVTLELQVGRERLPWLAVFVVVAFVSCVLGLIAVGPQRAARVLGEWLPTSGGTGGYDPFARGGINDGDEEVKGKNASSTGMVQSDTFLDSPLPSLYDMTNDLYGEPFKRREEQERAIALDGRAQVRESNKAPSDNLRPSRDFPTSRKGPSQPRDTSDRAARALFEVEGRTPLHVRAAVFNTFDGLSWHESDMSLKTCLLDKEPNSCWMSVQDRKPSPIFAGTETHQFKIATPLGTLLPTPTHLLRFRVGRVDQPTFFAWGPHRILRMAERKTPSGITVETESRTVDPKKFSDLVIAAGSLPDRAELARLPANMTPEMTALARQWTDQKPVGWEQIAAVVERLRTEYVHDPAAHTPEICTNPLAYFLLDARSGPDYQFASAAAVLLRVLGYPTRLVSGFYVSQDHYDSATRHTPVVKEDLHFWAEVMLSSGDWLVIEPTPGYEVLGPNLSWSERAWTGLLAGGFWLWEHIVPVTVGLLIIAALWWKRLEILDRTFSAYLRFFPGRSWHLSVRQILWLLERRGRWAGRPRPLSQTPSTWLRTVLHQQTDLQRLSSMAEWTCYGPDLTPPWSMPEVGIVCRRVLDHWTLPRWRKVLATGSARGD